MTRRSVGFGVLMLTSAFLAAGEGPKGLQEREYRFPPPTVKAALQKLGAYVGGRLPALEGFTIKTERVQLEHYELPYYEFKLDLVPVASDRTMVRVKANSSAWYADPQGTNSGYRAFESSGRLETNPEFPPYYGTRAIVHWHQGNQDAFVADWVASQLKAGRTGEAEAFAAGYRKGGMNGACTAVIELLKNKSRG